MKHTFLGVCIIASLLSGCNTEGPEEPIVNTKSVRPIFKPGEGALPLPNDILYLGSQDVTLNIPVPDPTDFSNSRVHLSSLDGWSTTAPFVIPFESENPAVGLSASSLIAGSTVRLFKVVTLADVYLNDADPANDIEVEVIPNTGIPKPTTAPVMIEKELEADVDFSVRLSSVDPRGLSVEVVPLKPLEPRSSYVLVFTNGLRDSAGVPLQEEGQYTLFSSGAFLESGDESRVSLTRLLMAINKSVSSDNQLNQERGVDPSTIILSQQFTTQSIGAALNTINSALLPALNQVAPIATGQFAAVVPPGAPSAGVCFLLDNCAAVGGAPISTVYQGQINLPYYLEPWFGGEDFTSSIKDPIEGFWMASPTLPDGSPNPLAALGSNLTYVNNLPAINNWETVPLLITVPNAGTAPYPVVIFQHGIRQNRTNALSVAQGLAQAGFAVVSIDLPLHGLPAATDAEAGSTLQQLAGLFGVNNTYNPATYTAGQFGVLGQVRERTFAVDYVDNATGAPVMQDSGLPGDGIPDASGQHFINLKSPLTARDNMQQASADLMALFRAIPTIDYNEDGTPDLDGDNVYFLGHSLGSIVGGPFGALTPQLKGVALINSSGGIARMVEGSPVFGPAVQAGLAAAGFEAGTPGYDQALWLLQSVIDSADMINYSSGYLTSGTPTLLLQVADDQYVINSRDGYPLVGTTPLASQYELTNVTETLTNPDGVRGFIRYNTGTHLTFLSPDEPAVMANMQSTVATFFASTGTTIPVANPEVIDTSKSAEKK